MRYRTPGHNGKVTVVGCGNASSEANPKTQKTSKVVSDTLTCSTKSIAQPPLIKPRIENEFYDNHYIQYTPKKVVRSDYSTSYGLLRCCYALLQQRMSMPP